MNKLRMYSASLTFRSTISRGELSPNVLITSLAQAEAILLYIKIGYVLNLKKLKSPLIFLSVILVF